MSDAVNKLIFDCLATLASSRFQTDAALGVGVEPIGDSKLNVRLFLFDAIIDNLVSLAETKGLRE